MENSDLSPKELSEFPKLSAKFETLIAVLGICITIASWENPTPVKTLLAALFSLPFFYVIYKYHKIAHALRFLQNRFKLFIEDTSKHSETVNRIIQHSSSNFTDKLKYYLSNPHDGAKPFCAENHFPLISRNPYLSYMEQTAQSHINDLKDIVAQQLSLLGEKNIFWVKIKPYISGSEIRSLHLNDNRIFLSCNNCNPDEKYVIDFLVSCSHPAHSHKNVLAKIYEPNKNTEYSHVINNAEKGYYINTDLRADTNYAHETSDDIGAMICVPIAHNKGLKPVIQGFLTVEFQKKISNSFVTNSQLCFYSMFYADMLSYLMATIQLHAIATYFSTKVSSMPQPPSFEYKDTDKMLKILIAERR